MRTSAAKSSLLGGCVRVDDASVLKNDAGELLNKLSGREIGGRVATAMQNHSAQMVTMGDYS